MSQNVAGILIFYKYQNKFGINVINAILAVIITLCVLGICLTNRKCAKKCQVGMFVTF